MRVVCFPTKWGKWREREDFEGIINCSIKGNVDGMQILPSLTWQGLLQHANPCFPLQTHPFQYHPPHTTLTILRNRTATTWMFAGLTWALAETLPHRKASLSNFVHVMSHSSCSLLKINMVSRHCVSCRREPRYQELLTGSCVWNQTYM